MRQFPEIGDTGPQWEAPTERAPGFPPAMPPLPRATEPANPYAGTLPLRRVVGLNAPTPRSTRPGQPRRGRWLRVLRYSLLALTLVTLVLGGVVAHRLYDFGSAISTRNPLSSQTGYVSGAGRINVLIMGYGGGSHDGANLTDSMMVISLIPNGGVTTMISVPRDLWIPVPGKGSADAKLNTAYQDGLSGGYNGEPAGRTAGGDEAARAVSDIIGLPVRFWVTIDFTGFRKLVDALGGVAITVPTAFTAQYPRNDDPRIDPGWKTIHFNTGPQRMTGEQAIEYARARYVTDPVSEGSDFARSARQQLLIHAILARARQVAAWPGLGGALDALQTSIYTNLSLSDLALFAEKIDATHAGHIGLTNQNVLVDSQSADGQDILLPANGDWNAIKAYVAAHLKA
ncbi:MAG TPA: LCP family protein [Ktedonobacterales bacterium]|nr:LCP family protein [Ktedonobacterales bacterium]